MRKILSLLTVTSVITSTTVNVVSCGQNANWREFNNWINNEETFLLYIGAENCDFCNHFEDALAETGNLVQILIDELVKRYEALLITNNKLDELTGFGQNITWPALTNLRKFVIEDLADNFNERWSENILNWVRDRLRDIYFAVTFAPSVEQEQNAIAQWNITNELVGNFLETTRGTPYFILIRNGQLAGLSTGFSRSDNLNHNSDIRKWFSTFSDFFMAEDLRRILVDMINNPSNETSTNSLAYNLDDDYINSLIFND